MSDPMLDFDLGEMADTIRETTRRFAKDKIEPIAAEIAAKDEFPRHLWPQMGALAVRHAGALGSVHGSRPKGDERGLSYLHKGRKPENRERSEGQRHVGDA